MTELVPIAVLAERLIAAGIPLDGINSDRVVAYSAEATQAQRDQGAAIVAAFDWTLTAEKQAEATATTNERTISQQVEAALANNATFLGLASPTTAQNAAQIKALTRQMNGLIRLVRRKLDAV